MTICMFGILKALFGKLGVTNPLIRSENQFKGAKRFLSLTTEALFTYIDNPEFYNEF